MTPDFDILIVGGGMVGACAAALLAQEPSLGDLRIALLEAQPPTMPPVDGDVDLRVSAISRASERILRRAQAWSHLPIQHRSEYSRMTVWDASSTAGGDGALHFSADETSEPNLGYIVENRRLQWALLEAAPLRERVTIIAAKLAGLEFTSDAAIVQLDDERKLRVRLVIGADGSASQSRAFAKIETAGWKYDQFALVTRVRTEKPHQATARQRFMPSGPLAFLPLADGRSSIVWTMSAEQSERLVNCSSQEFSAAIEEASGLTLGKISVDAARARFPLQLVHAKQYTRARFALIGDAAHAVHPLAGQGVNLGLLDCAALVETLSNARRAGASADALSETRVLRSYERWRKSENLIAMGMIDGLNRLFSNDNPALKSLRNGAFALMDKSPLAKRFFILRALGLAGETPAIVRAL